MSSKQISNAFCTQNIRKLFGIAIAAVFALSSAVCFGQSGDRNISSAKALEEYLDSQPANSPNNPIKITMSVNEQTLNDIVKVINSAGKYVSLTLTGSSLTTIPDSAFEGCKNLTSITIPNSVTAIEKYAFRYCDNLTGVTIPNGVITIGNKAFMYCTSLTSVTIPNSVTAIGEEAFSWCHHSLTSVIIGNGVTSFGPRAFNAFNLTSVTFQGTIDSGNNGGADINERRITPFPGDLWEKYLAGGVGTYKRPNGTSRVWTKQ